MCSIWYSHSHWSKSCIAHLNAFDCVYFTKYVYHWLNGRNLFTLRNHAIALYHPNNSLCAIVSVYCLLMNDTHAAVVKSSNKTLMWESRHDLCARQKKQQSQRARSINREIWIGHRGKLKHKRPNQTKCTSIAVVMMGPVRYLSLPIKNNDTLQSKSLLVSLSGAAAAGFFPFSHFDYAKWSTSIKWKLINRACDANACDSVWHFLPSFVCSI